VSLDPEKFSPLVQAHFRLVDSPLHFSRIVDKSRLDCLGS